jgi:hypothetical protein
VDNVILWVFPPKKTCLELGTAMKLLHACPICKAMIAFDDEKYGADCNTHGKSWKKQLLLSCQISPLFWHGKFHKPEM